MTRTDISGEDPAAAGSRAEVLREALLALPDCYRHVIELVRVDGLTLEHAGVLLGRSHAETRRLYGRALSRLAEFLIARVSGERGRAKTDADLRRL